MTPSSPHTTAADPPVTTAASANSTFVGSGADFFGTASADASLGSFLGELSQPFLPAAPSASQPGGAAPAADSVSTAGAHHIRLPGFPPLLPPKCLGGGHPHHQHHWRFGAASAQPGRLQLRSIFGSHLCFRDGTSSPPAGAPGGPAGHAGAHPPGEEVDGPGGHQDCQTQPHQGGKGSLCPQGPGRSSHFNSSCLCPAC